MLGSSAHRTRLVAKLRSRGVLRSPPVIDAFRAVAREDFAPEGIPLAAAYEDRALVLTEDLDGRATSTISQPSMVALMLEQLRVRSGDRVLEIGTASGYNAALLAFLTGPTGSVHSVELDPDLADRARDKLSGTRHISVVTGDGWAGLPECAPFDRIVVTVGVEDLSPAWGEQLVDGGTIVAPVTLVPGLELSLELIKSGSEYRSRSVEPCGFVRLRGPNAGRPGRIATTTGSVATRHPPDAETAQQIRDTVDSDPEDCGPLPDLTPGWSTWLVLEDPDAVVYTVTDGPNPVNLTGIRDPSTGGIAVVDHDRVSCFGHRRAADLLRAELRRAQPVDPHRLQVLALPSTGAGLTGRWVIRRPNHQYALWLGTQGAQVAGSVAP